MQKSNKTDRILEWYRLYKNGVDNSFLLKIHGSNNIDNFINKQELQKALEQLSFEEREILIMRVYEQMTFKEI